MTQPDRSAIAIGVDIGTSGVRAAALDADGAMLAMAEAPFADMSETRSPAAWWRGTDKVLKELASALDLVSVRGIAVDGTSGTVLALDADGRPLGDALMYNDVCDDNSIVDAIDRAAPAGSPARGKSSALARAILLQARPGVAKIVHQADWIAAGIANASPVSDENNALKTGYDLDRRQWPEWLDAAGMKRALLPDVYPTGNAVSTLGAYAASLGLPETAQLFAGTTDGCASFLATGASREGEGVTALGSTLVLKIASGHPINVPEFGIYSHRVRNVWLAGGASNSGGAVIRSLFGDERLGELTAKLDPDQPTGLDYYPLLRPGERFPVNDAHFEPRLTPRPDDDAVFFQGVLEGISEIERLGFARLQKFGGPALKNLRSVGGGTRNPVWTRMRQTRLGVPFLPAASTEAAVGTARLVLLALGDQ